MKRFLKTCGWGLLVFAIVSQGIAFMSPRGWGNELLREKIKIWSEKEPGKFNSIALGSSHVFRQVNPFAFDSITSAGGISLRTYNLGSPGTGNLENFPIAEYLIETAQPADGLKVMVVELLGSPAISNHDLIARWNYFISFSELKYMIEFELQENRKWTRKLERISKVCLLFLSGQMHVNHHELLAFMHPFFAIPQKKINYEEALNPDRAGWYALDQQIWEENTPNIRLRREEYLAKQAEGQDRVTLELKKERAKNRPLNPALLSRLRKIIQQADAKGIHCFFVTLPPTFMTLPDDILNDSELHEHFIHLSQPEKSPELYEIQSLFDQDHLNLWGSQRMTELLAEEVLDRLQLNGAR